MRSKSKAQKKLKIEFRIRIPAMEYRFQLGIKAAWLLAITAILSRILPLLEITLAP